MKKILQNTLTLFVVLTLFVHVNFIGFYYSLYFLNKKDLSETVCEKKNSCCNAKCYLNKKIYEEDNDSPSQSNSNSVKEQKLKISEFILKAKSVDLLSGIESNFITPEFTNISDGFRKQLELPPRL
ncbi:MAG: hypothetical protein JSS91_11190 [Bacteroidetes bacterium]|nr:hypothetical protein [Bacteroidota bacterium]